MGRRGLGLSNFVTWIDMESQMSEPTEPSQNPYQSPTAYEPRTTAATESPFGSKYEHLRRVAIYQKGVLIAVAVFLVHYAITYFDSVLELQLPLVVVLPLAVVGLVAFVGGTVAAGLLAVRLHGIWTGFALALCTFIPCVNLIIVFVLNQQANALFKGAGVHVGLFGARLSDLKPLDAEAV
jgi:hypothetical protein